MPLPREELLVSSPRPPTIRQVAERAGVSKSLVSLVLQGSAKVSDVKRAAVLGAIDELGYRPNGAARNLSSPRTNTVGVLLNDLRNPWFVNCLDGVASVLHANGLRMFLADAHLDRSMGDSLTKGFLEFRVDGLIIVGTLQPSPALEAAAAAVPTVVAASRDIALPRVDVVANDDVAGTRLAVEHLIGLGHRHIAHLSGNSGAVARLRHDTFIQVMEEAGLSPRVERTDMTEEGGYRAGVRLLRSDNPPTAVFAVNDMSCIGLLSAADELGIAVPQQLSLVGYDNTYLAGIRHIGLTTVDNASYEVGRQAADALLRRIATPTQPETLELITPRLQIRGSSSPVSSATTAT
jgi:DNA-binding LacI/PurR family transcriptional regulator